mgnify:CR=1 FL=1
MKTDIHPKYFDEAVVKCANCKNEFKTGATIEEIHIEICSKCHPFYTGGKNVLLDVEGRVDKFRQKISGAKGRVKKEKSKKTLEEKVNEEISLQLKKAEEKEEKAEAKRLAKKTKKEE